VQQEVTTIQAPPHQITIAAPPRWYPIALQLRYKATSKHGPLYGFGQTRMMSSKDIIFGPSEGLKAGMIAEIAIAWPALLEGHVRLQLVLETAITASEDGLAAAQILAYHFRTCRPSEPAPRTGPQLGEGVSELLKERL
jgi:hypothetical protein